MNLDVIEGADDAILLNTPEVAEMLAPRRRNCPLRFAQMQKLVETLDMGRTRHANIETYGEGTWSRWRLRFSLRDSDGKIMRKSIVIADAFVARWVREYLEQARKERPAYRLELRAKEHRRRFDADSMNRITSSLDAIMRGNNCAAPPEDDSSG